MRRHWRETILSSALGKIRPGKGLEAFIALAHLADAAGEPSRFLAIGSMPPRWLKSYARALRSQSVH